MHAVRGISFLLFGVVAAAVEGGAQVRTPIATSVSTTPGPAPTNVKVLSASPTSVALAWDMVGGARYLIQRQQVDNPTCCVAQSGYVTSGSWQDGGLTPGNQYAFAISALYSDGRSGSTQVMATTPFLSLSVGSMAYTACLQRTSGGPDPGPITPANASSPAGATLNWAAPSPTGTNYVVDRAPYGTTAWTFVGSTCGGPSPISVDPADPATGVSRASVRDVTGGVRLNNKYTYRVTRIGPKGEVGWHTVAWNSPCMKPPPPTATVSGSTVTVSWAALGPTQCGTFSTSTQPETYTLTSSFGYVKTQSAYGFTKDVIYGVPVGTHTFYLVAGWRPDAFSQAMPTTAIVSY